MKIAAALIAFALPFALPKPAIACDAVSYFQSTDGRCMDLSAITWLGIAQDRQSDIVKEAIPYDFQLIGLQPAAVPGGIVKGRIQLRNISQFSTIQTGSVLIFAPNGSTWRPFIEVDVPPGSTHVEEIFLDADPGSLLFSGRLTADYNPDLSRDYDGIGKLFSDRDSALDKAWPYPSDELTFCLGDWRCPGFAWSATGVPTAAPTATAKAQASSPSGACDVASDRAADGSRCGGRAASERAGGR